MARNLVTWWTTSTRAPSSSCSWYVLGGFKGWGTRNIAGEPPRQRHWPDKDLGSALYCSRALHKAPSFHPTDSPMGSVGGHLHMAPDFLWHILWVEKWSDWSVLVPFWVVSSVTGTMLKREGRQATGTSERWVQYRAEFLGPQEHPLGPRPPPSGWQQVPECSIMSNCS